MKAKFAVAIHSGIQFNLLSHFFCCGSVNYNNGIVNHNIYLAGFANNLSSSIV